MATKIWKIEWSDGMSVGIPEIDEDHKRFIALVNELNQSIVDHMDLAEIKKRLQLILDDAERHNAHEERLFKEWRYPDAEDHASKHALAVKAIQEIKEKSISYNLDSEWIDAAVKIKELLINHTLTEDMKFVDFYRNSRGAGTAVKA